MKNILFCVLFFLGSITSFSQGNGGNDPDIPAVPLDGGISLLLAAGAAYTTRRVIKNRKKVAES